MTLTTSHLSIPEGMKLHMNLHSESVKGNAENEAKEHILAKYLGQR